MERRDYLKKQIDELGKVLGKILADLLKVKQQGKVDEGVSNITQAFNEELEFDLEEILSIPENDFVSYLKDKKKFNISHLNVFSDILYHFAELFYEKEEDTKSRELYLRALKLLQYLSEKDKVYSFERHQKMNAIELLLKDL